MARRSPARFLSRRLGDVAVSYKPCLLGCDAHRPEEVGQPTHNRYSWMKGVAYRGVDLEDREVRYEVCKILEGGEPAFQDRARRLRVKMER